MCECPLALIGSIPCFISFRVFTQGKQFPHLLTHLKKKKKRKQLSSSIRTNLDIRAMTPSLSWAILSSCFSQTNHSLRDRLFIYIVVVISLSWMLYRNWKSLAWLAPDYLLFALCDELSLSNFLVRPEWCSCITWLLRLFQHKTFSSFRNHPTIIPENKTKGLILKYKHKILEKEFLAVILIPFNNKLIGWR